MDLTKFRGTEDAEHSQPLDEWDHKKGFYRHTWKDDAVLGIETIQEVK